MAVRGLSRLAPAADLLLGLGLAGCGALFGYRTMRSHGSPQPRHATGALSELHGWQVTLLLAVWAALALAVFLLVRLSRERVSRRLAWAGCGLSCLVVLGAAAGTGPGRVFVVAPGAPILLAAVVNLADVTARRTRWERGAPLQAKTRC